MCSVRQIGSYTNFLCLFSLRFLLDRIVCVVGWPVSQQNQYKPFDTKSWNTKFVVCNFFMKWLSYGCDMLAVVLHW